MPLSEAATNACEQDDRVRGQLLESGQRLPAQIGEVPSFETSHPTLTCNTPQQRLSLGRQVFRKIKIQRALLDIIILRNWSVAQYACSGVCWQQVGGWFTGSVPSSMEEPRPSRSGGEVCPVCGRTAAEATGGQCPLFPAWSNEMKVQYLFEQIKPQDGVGAELYR